MSVISADYFDGKRSLKHPVSIVIAKGRMKIIGREVSLDLDARRVRRSLRVANTPRWLYLPGGGACVTTDNDAVDRATRTRRYERLLRRWESRPMYAMVAVMLVAVTAWLLFDRGLPAAAEIVAEQIPVETEAALGQKVLEGLDEQLLQPSNLPSQRQGALRARFFAMVETSGEETAYRIEFRSTKVLGANAFALPAGIIVVTDPLVKLAKRDEEVLGVLAHELGHVKHRHSMRRIIESSVTALAVAGITGDVSSAASLAAAAPALLLQAKYSRGNEREADAFAIEMMRKSKINPGHLAAILARMEANAERRSGMPDFLSSHPATDERKAAALAGGPVKDEPSVAEAEKPRRAVLEPEHREVVALLEKRDFEELERRFAAHQADFEHNPAPKQAIEHAYLPFDELPSQAEAALGEWIAKMPASYAARTARGRYYLSKGFAARGGDVIGETPKENIESMRAYLAKAKADFDASLTLTAKPFVSQLSLIDLYRSSGTREQARLIYELAVKAHPQSVRLRHRWMSVLEPLWGGNQAEMEAYAAETVRQLSDPEAAASIAARVPAYRADELRRAKQWPQALAAYDEALKLHPTAAAFCNRSYVLGNLKRDAEAFADAKRGYALDRRNEYCRDRAVYVAGKVEAWNEIVALMSSIVEADPDMAAAYRERGWANHELKNFEAAFEDYLAAAKLGDSVGQLQLGRFYLHGVGVAKDREQAAVWVRKSAAQGEPQASKMLVEMGLAKKK